MSPAKKTTRKTKAKKTPARRKPASKKATPTKARATKKKAAAPASPAKTKKKAVTAEKKKAVTAEKKKAVTAEKKKAVAAEKPKAVGVAPQKKRAVRKATARKASVPPTSPPPDAHPRLGVKHTCFQCGAKFYDLFRPEPLCPKCGADQREAPKVETKRKAPAAPKRATKRAMAPLLDEEDEEPVFDELGESVLDLEPAGAELDDPAAETDDESDL